MAHRRVGFIERRKIVGLSQEKLAEVVGVDRNTVMRWENGDYAPQPGQRPPLAKALAVSVEELHMLLGAGGIFERAAGEGRTPYGLLIASRGHDGSAVHWPPESALTWTGADDPLLPDDQLVWLLRQLDACADGGNDWRSPKRPEVVYTRLVQFLARWAHTVKRRETLRVLGWAAAAAAGSAAASSAAAGSAGLPVLDEQESERVVRAIQAPRRVDDQVIDHIEAVLRHCMRQDDALGPQAAIDTVLAQRSLVLSLLAEAPVALRDRLGSVYANLSCSAGWLSLNLNSHDAAAGYYERARAAAHEAHNTELAAFVLGNMSHLATERNQTRVGIDHAVAAQGWADQTDDLRLRAYARSKTARALAMDGRGTASLTAVEQAHQTLTKADAERTTYAHHFDGGARNTDESASYIHLGNFDRAADIAEMALAQTNPSLVRTRAFNALRLGVCRLRSTKPDVAGAVQAIGEAGALATHNRSPRLVERLRRGTAELEPWRDVPEVRDVRERLTAWGVV